MAEGEHQLVEYEVNLKTDEAIQDMKQLDTKHSQTSRKGWAAAVRRSRVGGFVMRHSGLGLPAVGGRAALSRGARIFAGNADPWDHALSPARAAVQQFIDEQVGFDARARNRARRATAVKLGTHYYHSKDNVGIKLYNDTLYDMFKEENDGRKILRANKALEGPSLLELLEQSIKGYGLLIGASFDYIVDAITE